MSDNPCWLCKSSKVKKIKDSSIERLSSDSYAITNSDYGVTHAIYKCQDCGFLQCSDAHDVLSYYEELVDQGYEDTREERKLQEEKIIDLVKKYKPQGKLLDIGAGSGILVDVALKENYEAIGVEPSKWLQANAVKMGLPVELGIFPHENISGKFDVITMVDVIEHVDDPLGLVREVEKYLKDDGIFLMATPDVSSIMARLLRFKWWHFRVAHIGYFNKKTMELLTSQAGLNTLTMLRPKWYFSMTYLIERIQSYLPKLLRLPKISAADKITIPLNLHDSWLGVYSKRK